MALSGGRRAFVVFSDSLAALWIPFLMDEPWQSWAQHISAESVWLAMRHNQPSEDSWEGGHTTLGDISLESLAIRWPNPSWIPGVDNPGYAFEPQRVLSRLWVFYSGLLSSFSCAVCFLFLMWVVCLSLRSVFTQVCCCLPRPRNLFHPMSCIPQRIRIVV